MKKDINDINDELEKINTILKNKFYDEKDIIEIYISKDNTINGYIISDKFNEMSEEDRSEMLLKACENTRFVNVILDYTHEELQKMGHTIMLLDD